MYNQSMTVGKLIQELQKLDPKLKAVVAHGKHGYSDEIQITHGDYVGYAEDFNPHDDPATADSVYIGY